MTHKLSSLDVYGDRTIGEVFKRLILPSHIQALNDILQHCGIPATKKDQFKINKVAKLIWLDPVKRKLEQLVELCFVDYNLPKVGKE